MSDQPTHHDKPTAADDVNDESGALAPLSVGDDIPWRLDEDGEPQWLTVVAVQRPGVYLVRYPNGQVEPLIDDG